MYASHDVSGTLNKRMCGKIVNAHVLKMAGKITHFFSSKSGKEPQDKEPSNGIQPPAKKVIHVQYTRTESDRLGYATVRLT